MSPFTPATPPAIQDELDAGERVLWTAQPNPAHMGRRALGGAAFGIFILAFSLFWLWGASDSLRGQVGAGQTPDLFSVAFPAFGLIFVVFALAMVLSPLTEPKKARRTFYALTDKRALIVVKGTRAKVQSVLPGEFSIERNDKPNGRSDLILKRETSGGGEDRKTIEIGFYGIENAREVEKLARQIAA